MGKFALPKWQSNEEGDEVSNTLFKDKTKGKTKQKFQNGGRIVKAKLNKAKVDINKKLIKGVGKNLENTKQQVNKAKTKIIKNLKALGSNENQSRTEDEINTSQKKLIKKKKKTKHSPGLPNFNLLKSAIESKLVSIEEDQKNLITQDGDQTFSDDAIKSKKKIKKKPLKNLKNDISKKIDSNIMKMQKKKKVKTQELQKSDNLNTTVDAESEDEVSLLQNKGKKQKTPLTLRERMMSKLKASRFRYLNEQLYCSPSKDAQNFFNTDPDSYKAYHDGFRQQVNRWPINPVDVIIKSLKKMNKTHVIADFGCGDAKIAGEVQQKVHSFDLVATNERVTACDMAKVPLKKESVDVAVFCLSLMGTNLQDYLKEANRVLKIGGILKIAEVESRFENVEEFIQGVQRFGFQNTHKDLSHNIFYFMDFKKIKNIKKTKSLPVLSLNPCLYKKR